MTPAQFRIIGLALYGPAWLTPMATALECSTKTIQRYLEPQRPGGHGIPPAKVAKLYSVMRAHSATLRALALTIRKQERTAK